MTSPPQRATPLDPELLLRAYSIGIFPMAESRDSPDVFWVEPRQRGIFPLDAFHLPKSLARTLRRERFAHSVDRAFGAVVDACAGPAPGRSDTWINAQIVDSYRLLHRIGHAHSVETWRDGVLVGGLYGVRIGAAFFGESMFSRVADASKAALAHLVARLRMGRFRLLDAQFLTPHLARLGAVEVSRDDYLQLLSGAVSDAGADFGALDAAAGFGDAPTTMVSGPVSGKRIVQLLTQTS
jgi:leucyl/phenylalanyl-tRNA--protein transferase